MQRKNIHHEPHAVPHHILKVEVKEDNTEISNLVRAAKKQKPAPLPSGPTLQEKYDWLCAKLEITDPDFWENDALIKIKQSYPNLKGDTCRSMYFQFSDNEYPKTIDEAIVCAMKSEMK